MNKKTLSFFAVLFCSVAVNAWQTDSAGSLKFVHNGQLILEETGLNETVFTGDPASVTAPHVSAKRSVTPRGEDFLIAVDAYFAPVKFIPAYSLRIPETVLKDAKLTAIVPGKKGRAAVAIPDGKNWQLEKVVYLAVEKEGLKFALDFEWTGSSAFQHYRDEAWSGTLKRDENGLQITLFRLEEPLAGGNYKARIVLRTGNADYENLHGRYQAHYKKNMPVSRFFAFTPVKQRPVLFGGFVGRDDDVKAYLKRFVKAVVVPVSYRIPDKYGGGGLSFHRQLKFHANKTENPVYAYAVSGSRKPHEFTMSLPDGYYFLTFHVRDDSVAKAYQYCAEVNGVKRMIAVKGAKPAATRFIVKVENGKVNVKFPDRRNPWKLSAVSAAWIAGKADMDIDVKSMKEFQL